MRSVYEDMSRKLIDSFLMFLVDCRKGSGVLPASDLEHLARCTIRNAKRKNDNKKTGVSLFYPNGFIFCLLNFAIVGSLRNKQELTKRYKMATFTNLESGHLLRFVVIGCFRSQRDAIKCWQAYFACLQLISRHLLLPQDIL